MIQNVIILAMLSSVISLTACVTAPPAANKAEFSDPGVYVTFDLAGNGRFEFREITNIIPSQFNTNRPAIWIDPLSLQRCSWHKPRLGFRGCELKPHSDRATGRSIRAVMNEPQALELVARYNEYQRALKEAGERHRKMDKRLNADITIVNNTGWPLPEEPVIVQADIYPASDRPGPEFYFKQLASKTFSGFINQLDQALTEINASYREGTYHRMKVSCRGTGNEPSVTFACPEYLDSVEYSDTPNVPATVTMLGRQYVEVTPPSFEASDKNITISVVDGVFHIANKTSDYVELKEITLYWADSVKSKKYAPPATFPPDTYAELKLTLQDLGPSLVTRREADYTKVSQYSRKYISQLDYTEGKHKYGFAVSYAKRGASTDDTLYRVTHIPRSDVVHLMSKSTTNAQ